MKRSRLGAIALSAALLTAGLSAGAPALASQACGASGGLTTLNGSLPDHVTYLIQCPAGPWNGTLFLYSHGYVVPGTANPAQDAGDPVTGGWLLSHGYALAGSSYATTGRAVQQALPDQISTLNVFDQTYRTPTRTIAWGHSLGGIIPPRSVTRRAGSPRSPPSPPAATSPARKPTSISGTPRSTSRSSSHSAPNSKPGPAGTRPGTAP